MAEKINWTINVQVVGGPTIPASDTVTVDAYDKIQVTVDDDAPDKVVEVQPGPKGRVQFLFVKPKSPHEDLTYKVNDAGDAIKLDAPQLLMGDGAVGLLGDSPESLSFTNKSGKAASIDILVGRNVTGE